MESICCGNVPPIIYVHYWRLHLRTQGATPTQNTLLVCKHTLLQTQEHMPCSNIFTQLISVVYRCSRRTECSLETPFVSIVTKHEPSLKGEGQAGVP